MATAARNGRLDCVRWFIEKGENLDTPDNDRRTPGFHTHQCVFFWFECFLVFEASFNGHIDCVRILVEAGANISTPSKKGVTCGNFHIFFLCTDWRCNIWVYVAAEKGKADVLQFLDSQGANLSKPNNYGTTPRKNHNFWLCFKIHLFEWPRQLGIVALIAFGGS